MTYDPSEQSYTAEESVELKDGNVVSMRVTVQDGDIVGGTFISSPGYSMKGTDVAALSWDKVAKAARAAERSSQKEEK